MTDPVQGRALRNIVPITGRFGVHGADDTGIDERNPEPPDEPQVPVLADRTLTRSALNNLPTPEPLIRNVLDQGSTALLYGSWGTAKSFIALDWAASVATARRWQGRDTVQRRALYVAGEGAYGFRGRIDAWETGWQKTISDEWFHILPQPVNLTRPVEVDQLRALIEWGGYSFIILDTLARCMVGGEENSAKDCGIVVDAMTRLLNSTPERRGVVLGVHHAGKDGKTLRGSSAFESGADTVYFTSRDGRAITLDRQKRKDGPENDRHELKLAQIGGTESCVIELHRPTATTDRGQALSCTYDTYFAATGCTPTQLLEVSGVPKHTFYRAVADLLKAGELVNTGTDKRPFYRRPGDE
jgi:hypothetical protein